MEGKKLPLPTFSSEQVRSHSSQSDLWMVVYNKVYDITEFANLHPGGVEVLLDCAGVDATEAFQDVGHSQDAFEMLLPYLVGELPPNEHKKYANMLETGEKEVGVKRRKKKRPMKNEDRRRQLLVVALVVLALLALLTVVVLQKLQWLKITAY